MKPSGTAEDREEQTTQGVSKPAVVALILFSGVIGTLWAFPSFWYANRRTNADYAWFAEQTQIAGWEHRKVPIGKSAEAILVADRIVNGEFSQPDGRNVLVYSAKRYLEKENEIGLFSHTPDRCWTATGWKIDPAEPSFIKVPVDGIEILFERRIFVAGMQRQLVYFGALVGGKPLPYRIDQYLVASTKRKDGVRGDSEGTWQRLKQPRLWSWAWDSFINRTPLSGPQQFFRVSTPIRGSNVAEADDLLMQFLPQWLVRTEYASEFAAWNALPLGEKQKQGGDAGIAAKAKQG